MPKYFGLSKWRSFHRQLNFYQFQKQSTPEKTVLVFKNQFFMKEHPERMHMVMRNDIERNKFRVRSRKPNPKTKPAKQSHRD